MIRSALRGLDLLVVFLIGLAWGVVCLLPWAWKLPRERAEQFERSDREELRRERLGIIGRDVLAASRRPAGRA